MGRDRVGSLKRASVVDDSYVHIYVRWKRSLRLSVASGHWPQYPTAVGVLVDGESSLPAVRHVVLMRADEGSRVRVPLRGSEGGDDETDSVISWVSQI